MELSEEELIAGLLDAQRKAEALFAEIQAQSLIRPGAKESEINESVYALAGSMYGISRYWHKRIVRAGRNTLAPYDENPPDLTVGEDDIVFLDLGPVFEEWEADFGRTYVVGNDPRKRKLCRDIEEAFASGKRYFHEHPEITAAELYAYAQKLAEEAGWEYGGPIAGHLIGIFPHEKIAGTRSLFMSTPRITTGCSCRTLLAGSGTGYWRFTLSIGYGRSVGSTKNC
jgi:Xaa-Pro dipeptidase